MERTTLIILAIVCIVIFIAPLAMFNGLGEDEGYFVDDLGDLPHRGVHGGPAQAQEGNHTEAEAEQTD